MENPGHNGKNSLVGNSGLHIFIAYSTQALIIAVTFFDDYFADYNTAVTFALIVSGAYLIYWIIAAKRSYMPWVVYYNFLAGCAVEVLLNISGVIAGDRDAIFFPGLMQFFYTWFIVAKAVIMLLCNFVMQQLFKRRIGKAKQ